MKVIIFIWGHGWPSRTLIDGGPLNISLLNMMIGGEPIAGPWVHLCCPNQILTPRRLLDYKSTSTLENEKWWMITLYTRRIKLEEVLKKFCRSISPKCITCGIWIVYCIWADNGLWWKLKAESSCGMIFKSPWQSGGVCFCFPSL